MLSKETGKKASVKYDQILSVRRKKSYHEPELSQMAARGLDGLKGSEKGVTASGDGRIFIHFTLKIYHY